MFYLQLSPLSGPNWQHTLNIGVVRINAGLSWCDRKVKMYRIQDLIVTFKTEKQIGQNDSDAPLTLQKICGGIVLYYEYDEGFPYGSEMGMYPRFCAALQNP